MRQKRFSKWTYWAARTDLENIKYPGIYAIAISNQNLHDEPFSVREEIVYFGMTNSTGGLRSRLRQFQSTLKGKKGHGGADRFMGAHSDYSELVKKLYVAVSYTKCSVTSNLPHDLLAMGRVVKQEYECLAEYSRLFEGRRPLYNDRKAVKRSKLDKAK
ncbi:MAG: hypothetical protein IPP57_23285 [Candidatus Obscuribacter sp.]|nr:hypothetical protein [Candidatus Obscuribacter sp.]MBK9205488.1 hypothetical protein [Candidatus Obscuribacter sp.]MBK9773702.1 hypothetical protein [Candidatus Obscuribacter sp.]